MQETPNLNTSIPGLASPPSLLGNWVARLMPGAGQALVHPCVIEGQHTLVHERGLQQSDPLSYARINRFARDNGFAVREDRRANFIEGVRRVRNKRRANVMTVMALSATLLSQGAMAHAQHHGDQSTSSHIDHGDRVQDLDLNVDANTDQEKLVSAMFDWINRHSSFEHDVSVMPAVKKVPAEELARVAFGGKLPQAVDPVKLRIYGLYNFNEEAVYILETLDLNTEKGKGILLHELVHFLQYQYDQDENVACKNELESLAYLLEARFLQNYDHDHKINMQHINRVSQCA